MGTLPVRPRALLSVTDRTRLYELAAFLASQGVELLASGGTATHLREHGLTVTDVSQVTGFPEVFGGRVKTLHPTIHGGILGPSATDFAEENAAALGLAPIDIVVVNLYRFNDALKSGACEQDLIEHIDIGGPALLRAAAKNHARVTVLSSPDQYEEFLSEFRQGDGRLSPEFRRRCALAAFETVATYDRTIADWLQGLVFDAAPRSDAAGPSRAGTPETVATLSLRYGENPHQGAVGRLPEHPHGGLAGVGLILHGGKALSYNNLVDTIAALKLVQDFDEPCCAVIKHTNPCGIGLGPCGEALQGALLCDPVSAFGGIVAFNQPVTAEAAETLRSRFLEVVAATAFCEDSLKLLLRRRNLRVMTWDPPVFQERTRGRARRWGDLQLEQDEDEGFAELDDWRIVAGPPPDSAARRDLELAWKAAKHGKSNAIVLARDGATIGCGFGQMSRVDSVRLALCKAASRGFDCSGSAAASDGFFPFADGVEELARAGVRWILAPGGSIRDEEVAAAARQLGVTFILASRRHFNH